MLESLVRVSLPSFISIVELRLEFNVLYSDKIIPTPVLAYNAKLLDACALMFTASHNPPEYYLKAPSYRRRQTVR